MPALERRFSSLEYKATDVFESIARILPSHTISTLSHTLMVMVVIAFPQPRVALTGAT